MERKNITHKDETKDKPKHLIKNEALRQFAKLLLEDGFKVYYTPDEHIKWLHFESNKGIGCVSINYYYGLDFSTCHKPNRITGTGFRLNTDGVINATIKDAESCFNIPLWAKKNEIDSVKPYKNWADYLSVGTNTILEHKELTLKEVV